MIRVFFTRTFTIILANIELSNVLIILILYHNKILRRRKAGAQTQGAFMHGRQQDIAALGPPIYKLLLPFIDVTANT